VSSQSVQDTQTALCHLSQFRTHRPLCVISVSSGHTDRSVPSQSFQDTQTALCHLSHSPCNFQFSVLFQCWRVLIWGLFIWEGAVFDVWYFKSALRRTDSALHLSTEYRPVIRLGAVIGFVCRHISCKFRSVQYRHLLAMSHSHCALF
jgi:hypothetical protein